MSEALARVSPELVTVLRGLNEPELRAAMLAACTAAVEVARVVDLQVQEALAALRRGLTGDVVERLGVRALAQELDVIAWDIQDRAEVGQATDIEYREAFGRARAAAALDQAFGTDMLRAAYETVYEASFAIDDLSLLKAAVRADS